MLITQEVETRTTVELWVAVEVEQELSSHQESPDSYRQLLHIAQSPLHWSWLGAPASWGQWQGGLCWGCLNCIWPVNKQGMSSFCRASVLTFISTNICPEKIGNVLKKIHIMNAYVEFPPVWALETKDHLMELEIPVQVVKPWQHNVQRVYIQKEGSGSLLANFIYFFT